MKKATGITLIIVLAILIAVAVDGTFTVKETQQAIVTQFGDPVGKAITQPGLKFKIPFIQKVHFFDKRYLEWDGDRNQVPTRDKKFIFVDTYARWKIVDPLQFYKRLRNELGAQSRLDDILDGETRDVIASNDLVEVVRSTNRQPKVTGKIAKIIQDTLRTISVGRDTIQAKIQRLSNEQAKDLGIKILDFRFKRINYVQQVRQTVYQRMISERQRIADKFRSEGQGEAANINGKKDRELKSIQSQAFRKAQEIKGKADAQAALIYAQAYNQSLAARKLYRFTRTMNAYKQTFDKKTSLILSTKSDFFKYLNNLNN